MAAPVRAARLQQDWTHQLEPKQKAKQNTKNANKVVAPSQTQQA
jgi:hypothetical protein